MPARQTPLLNACLLMLMTLGSGAQAQGISQDEYTDAAARLSQIEGRADLLSTCPADLYATQRSLAYRLFGRSAYPSYEACAADIVSCASACADDADPRACYHAATLLEQSRIAAVELDARIGHALACATGEPSGCTNRGGGIRNVPVDGDLLSFDDSPEGASCLFRTFESACDEADSWACAMAGQSHALGEGTPRNEVRAMERYTRACTLAEATTFPSCVFAKTGLAALNSP